MPRRAEQEVGRIVAMVAGAFSGPLRTDAHRLEGTRRGFFPIRPFVRELHSRLEIADDALQGLTDIGFDLGGALLADDGRDKLAPDLECSPLDVRDRRIGEVAIADVYLGERLGQWKAFRKLDFDLLDLLRGKAREVRLAVGKACPERPVAGSPEEQHSRRRVAQTLKGHLQLVDNRKAPFNDIGLGIVEGIRGDESTCPRVSLRA